MSAFSSSLLTLAETEGVPEARSDAERSSDSDDGGEPARRRVVAYDVDEEALLFISRLPPLSQCTPGGREAALPPKRPGAPSATLVLDLDETLVHSSLELPSPGATPPDFSFPVQFEGASHLVHVRKRPGLRVRAPAALVARSGSGTRPDQRSERWPGCCGVRAPAVNRRRLHQPAY